MKIPLTIDVNYLPDWGVYEGLRELLQNWLDAADVAKQPGELGYDKEKKIVTLRNPGATIKRDALLLGVTSKPGTTQRGQFGEGLKLGSLALVRNGCPVIVHTGAERWLSRIEESDDFPGRNVLAWIVTPETSKMLSPTVSVHVMNVPEEAWTKASAAFRCFKKADPQQEAPGSHGTLLKAPAEKGNVYVRGIMINHDPKLAFGYDFTSVNVDRDRKLVRDYDMQSHCASILSDAYNNKMITVEIIYTLLAGEAKDVGAIQYYSNVGLCQQVAKHFQKLHGKNTVPVNDPKHVAELAHLDYKGVAVPKNMLEILTPYCKTLEQAREEVRTAVVQKFALSELTGPEVEVYQWAHAQLFYGPLADTMRAIHAQPCQVVQFKSPLMGLYSKGNAMISRHLLDNPYKTLGTMIHEIAHFAGGDGTPAHIALLQEWWEAIAQNWAPYKATS